MRKKINSVLFQHDLDCGHVFRGYPVTQIRQIGFFYAPGVNESFDILCRQLGAAVQKILPDPALFQRFQRCKMSDLGLIGRQNISNWGQIADHIIVVDQAVCMGPAYIPPRPGIRFKCVKHCQFV